MGLTILPLLLHLLWPELLSISILATAVDPLPPYCPTKANPTDIIVGITAPFVKLTEKSGAEAFRPLFEGPVSASAGLNVTVWDAPIDGRVLRIFDCPTIDIALTGPFVTACLQSAYEQMSPLTVEIDLGGGLATSLAGGQIVTLNTSGILVPRDLKGKTISAANFISPGGLPQIHALQDDADFNAFTEARQVRIVSNSYYAAMDVLEGVSDAGFIGFYELKRLQDNGFDVSSLRIIGSTTSPDGSFVAVEPFLPGWGITFLRLNDGPIFENIAFALKSLSGDLPEMEKASVSRFVWGTTYIRAWHILLQMSLLKEVQHNNFKCIETADEKASATVYEYASSLCPEGTHVGTPEEFASSCQNFKIPCPADSPPPAHLPFTSAMRTYSCLCSPCIPDKKPPVSRLGIGLAVALSLLAVLLILAVLLVIRSRLAQRRAMRRWVLDHTKLRLKNVLRQDYLYLICQGEYGSIPCTVKQARCDRATLNGRGVGGSGGPDSQHPDNKPFPSDGTTPTRAPQASSSPGNIVAVPQVTDLLPHRSSKYLAAMAPASDALTVKSITQPNYKDPSKLSADASSTHSVTLSMPPNKGNAAPLPKSLLSQTTPAMQVHPVPLPSVSIAVLRGVGRREATLADGLQHEGTEAAAMKRNVVSNVGFLDPADVPRGLFAAKMSFLISLRGSKHVATVLGAALAKDAQDGDDSSRRVVVFVVLQGRFRSTVAEELQAGKETLDLATRVAWCLEAAEGLLFLHEATLPGAHKSQPFVHGSVSTSKLLVTPSSNVELDPVTASLVTERRRSRLSRFSIQTHGDGPKGWDRGDKSPVKPYGAAEDTPGDAPDLPAPEFIIRPETTQASDVFDFGTTMYNILRRPDIESPPDYGMITGHMQGGNVGVLRGMLERVDHIVQPLSDLILECWTINPDRRPGMKEIRDRLSSVAGHPKVTKAVQLERRERDKQAKSMLTMPKTFQETLRRGSIPAPLVVPMASIVSIDLSDGITWMRQRGVPEMAALAAVDRLFDELDSVAEAFKLFRLPSAKGIHMTGGNIHEPLSDHAKVACRFALECRRRIASQDMLGPGSAAVAGSSPGSSRPYLFVIGIGTSGTVCEVDGGAVKRFVVAGDGPSLSLEMRSVAQPGKIYVAPDTKSMAESSGDLVRAFRESDRPLVFRAVRGVPRPIDGSASGYGGPDDTNKALDCFELIGYAETV